MTSDDARQADGSDDATARIVDPAGTDDERRVEAALRPRRLADFPGLGPRPRPTVVGARSGQAAR